MIHSELVQASSLHPKILTKLEVDSESPRSDCHLDVIYTLPPSVFVDPYQLKDLENVIGSSNVFGEHDLELPLEKIKEIRGSIVFLRQVRIPKEIELPIHLRYQQPSIEKDRQAIQIESPQVGWTCGGDSLWPALSHALVPRQKNQENIEFFPLVQEKTVLELYMPIGKIQDIKVVSLGTMCVIMGCTVWIVYSILASFKKRKRSEAKGKRRKSE